MSVVRETSVRGRAIRVALASTGLVAIAYLLVAIGVVVLVTGNLTSQIDGRLASFLASSRISADGGDEGGTPPTGGLGADDRPFGPPTLLWSVDASGTSTYVGPADYAVDLPVSFASISNPETVSINGTALRMAGRQVNGTTLIAAQTLSSVTDAQTTILLAEALIAPILLAIVFLGAVTIGFRVASPIEAARRRQLEFTADASHELRTPLSVIEAHTSLGLAQERSAAWYRTAFERVEDELRRMRRLLDDMLWLARFDAAQAAPSREPVDLGVLAEATAERFGPVAEARQISVSVGVGQPGVTVSAPPEWLDHLLGVLLDNACKYAPPGGEVTVGVTDEHGRAVLTVDDTGPGIPESERRKIFDRFHRATDSTSGAGLGLAIGDAIVRATGGQWRVGSAPGGGARLQVSWPDRSASSSRSRRD
jgi:signal transduction histidine kinase